MIKQYYKQALAQLRQHPLISIIGIVGTALSIFLIMLVVMMQQVKVAPFSPESNRNRFLHVHYMSISHKDWGNGTSNGPMSVQTAREVYKSLKTPEAVTVYCCMTVSTPVSLPGAPAIGADVRETDDTFFHVFDFQFTDGKPYDEATFTAGRPVAVITESISRALFGSIQSVGKEFLLSHAPYRVVGVVKDVSTLADMAYGQVWIPFTSTNLSNDTWSDNHMGMMSVTLLAHDREDFDEIRADFVYQVGQPLAFFFPREVDTPQGVFQRFFSHVYFCGERLFVQEHERPTEREVLAHVVLQVESYERFALHAVVVVAFKVHAHVRTCVDDALVDDGHHAHGVIHRVVLVLHQRYPAGRDGHGALWHVHGSEADFGTVVSLVLSGEQEFVLFRYLLGHGLGGVVQCVETILFGQGFIVQIFTQVASERFGHGEIDAPFVDGVSLHVVELSVGVRTVVGIQAV